MYLIIEAVYLEENSSQYRQNVVHSAHEIRHSDFWPNVRIQLAVKDMKYLLVKRSSKDDKRAI